MNQRGGYTFPHLNLNSNAKMNSLVLRGIGITTGSVLSVAGPELTIGKALSILSDSLSPSTRALVEFENANIVAVGTTVLKLVQGSTGLALDCGGSAEFKGRVKQNKGSNVASASQITLPTNGNFFTLTGTTAIDTIVSTGWTPGSVITFLFSSTLTLNDSSSGSGDFMAFAGNVNFIGTDTSTVSLIYNGGVWTETGRAIRT